MIPGNAPLPLRETSVWGGFASSRVIPHRYGSTAGQLLQYDASGRLWCWADHACLGIDDVVLDGKKVSNWQFGNDIDDTGHAVALVEFDQAQSTSAQIIAVGRGKPHPRAGGLMNHPADVIWDVLAHVAGMDVKRSQLDAFASACAGRGLTMGGSLEQAASVQTVVRSMAASMGAIYSADARSLCALWPGPVAGPARGHVDTAGGLTASATLDDLINDVTLQFDLLDGQPRQTLRLQAPDSVTRYGHHARTVILNWVVESRVAFDVGKRLLQQAARPQWHINAELGRHDDVRVADTVDLQHAASPVSGLGVLQSRSLALDTDEMTGKLVMPSGLPPTVQLVSQSRAFDPQQVSVATQGQGSSRTLTLTEADGTPISNAQVTLDGEITRSTNAAGQVTFPAAYMTPGEHTIDIVTGDGRSLSQTILVN